MSKEKTSDSESFISSSDVNRRSFLKGLAVAGSAAAVGVSGCLNGDQGGTTTEFACPWDDETFESEEELQQHIEDEHFPDDTGNGSSDEREPQSGLTLVVDYTKCTGCKVCELACAERYQEYIHPDTAEETINLDYSRIQVGRQQFVDTVNVCRYCTLYEWAEGSTAFPCEEVCPVENAIVTVPEGEGEEGYNGMGYKKVNRDACLGLENCGKCLEICEEQFGTGMIFDPEEQIAQVCTRCGGLPTCQDVCPEDAIEFAAPGINGRYFAHTPEDQAKILYRKMYDTQREMI